MADVPPHLRPWFFAFVTLFLSSALVGAAWRLYSFAGKSNADFLQKTAELSLQLAVIVVIGGAVKAIADWRSAERDRIAEQAAERRELISEQAAQRREFARRTREMHVTIELARDLLRAHRSPRTYAKQLQNLLRLRFQVEDLREDFSRAGDLFQARAEILSGLDGVLDFLQGGREEYERAHQFVGENWPKTTFEDTIAEHKMEWVRTFIAGEGPYEEYLKSLGKSKGRMRSEVYGA